MRAPFPSRPFQRFFSQLAKRSVLVLVATSTLAWAQEVPRRHSAEERYQLFEQNLKRRARGM
jgi:hypothetical protein